MRFEKGREKVAALSVACEVNEKACDKIYDGSAPLFKTPLALKLHSHLDN